MNRTKIETCELTWNPLTGCRNNCKARFGFDCYAAGVARFHRREFPHGFEPHWREDRLWQPTERVKPALIMVCSMADLFGDWVPAWQIKRVLWVIGRAHWHTFQLFTKNPGRLASFSPFPPNCWVGVSVPDGSVLDAALDGLRRVKAPVRFISFEPLMGEIAMPTNHRRPLPFEWAIIGGLSGRRGKWSHGFGLRAVNLSDQLTARHVPVFCKSNLGFLITTLRQWPRGLEPMMRRATA